MSGGQKTRKQQSATEVMAHDPLRCVVDVSRPQTRDGRMAPSIREVNDAECLGTRDDDELAATATAGLGYKLVWTAI